jgi:hypothetical protein
MASRSRHDSSRPTGTAVKQAEVKDKSEHHSTGYRSALEDLTYFARIQSDTLPERSCYSAIAEWVRRQSSSYQLLKRCDVYDDASDDKVGVELSVRND